MKTELLALFADALSEVRVDLAAAANLDSVAQYASERAAHLSTLVDQPGFEQAVRAERDAVMLQLANTIVKRADVADRLARERLTGLVQGSLAMGARLLAVA